MEIDGENKIDNNFRPEVAPILMPVAIKHEDVQMISPQQAERESRRKRRRRLYRLLKQPMPSFLAVLQSEPTEDLGDENEEDEDIPSPMVVIDVDAYLGFQAKMAHPDAVSSWSPVTPRPALSAAVSSNPADEGWYEGRRIMAMPEDSTFLSDVHVWVRQHLEFFSATDQDVQHSSSVRRSKTVRGKVGLRCIHCARKVLSQLEAGKKVSWPAGSVTYPLNFAALYSGVSQKPQHHFESCPNLPPDSQLATILQEARATQRGNAPLTGIGKRKRMVQGVSGLMYYVISCQRIGMVEVEDQGLRFGRDLSLEPFPFETIRLQVEQERPDLIPRQYQTKPTPPTTTLLATSTAVPDLPGSSGESVTTHPSIQAVLQRALDEADGDPQKRLIRRSDKILVTDHMFLAVSQMAICHATSQDLTTRGKKTKLMRLGLAGFCCRYCQHKNTMSSCRSYSSAPDNLASAISNSFVIHLLKCPYTPREIQEALTLTKKTHTRQMANLPYGSQRRMFVELWNRLRALDRSSGTNDEDNEEDENDTKDDNDDDDGDDEWDPEVEATKHNDEDEDDDTSPTKLFAAVATRTVDIGEKPTSVVEATHVMARGENFPVCDDAETLKVLNAAEKPWDTSINDHLILPEDRLVVSDYVFLTMRQIKIALPTPSDFRGNRRHNVLSRMPGLCCLHCAHDASMQMPSGRSFPSAPDNLASCLNSSFYNHMQNCTHLDATTKRALQYLRKLHSQQCSSLPFGSQRRFFNKVYHKLKQVPMTEEQRACFTMGGKEIDASTPSPVLDQRTFREHSFVEAGMTGIPYWQCLHCRMVPFEFRSIGAVHYVRPLLVHLQQHRSVCQGDGISLVWANHAIRELCDEYQQEELVSAMKPLIEIVVGNDADLVQLFHHCLSTSGRSQSVAYTQDTSGWWRRLPQSINIADLQAAFEEMATKLGLSSSRLTDHPKFVRALEVMSPSLQVPLNVATVIDDASANTCLASRR